MAFKRVVVTGLGPITPVGIGKEAFWEALVSGKSGARQVAFEDCEMDQYNSRIACPVLPFDLGDFIPRTKSFRYLGRTSEFALAGARLALEDAGFTLLPREGEKGEFDFTLEGVASHRVGAILGVGAQNMDLCERWHKSFLKHHGPKRVSPFALPHVQICSVPVTVTMKYGIQGIASTVSTACASSNHAMIASYKQIVLGEETVMVTGGADACITPFVFGGFSAMNAMSRRNDEPEKASRPFDKNRDGFVMGEGAGIVILEERAHALARGARIYCEMTGYGATSDAYHIAAPEPSARMQAKAMEDALRRAGRRPEEIDYINAHGTSTLLNDPAETRAIKEALGKHAYRISINSTKSITGHMIGAAGGVEAIATALTIERGWIHPTINLDHPDPECDLNYTPRVAVKASVTRSLNNSFGFGGQNASIVLERFEP